MENDVKVTVEIDDDLTEIDDNDLIEIDEQEIEVIETVTDSAVKIAEIEADKEIAIAEIQATVAITQIEAQENENEKEFEPWEMLNQKLEILSQKVEQLLANQLIPQQLPETQTMDLIPTSTQEEISEIPMEVLLENVEENQEVEIVEVVRAKRRAI